MMKNNAMPIVMAEQDEKLEWERLIGPLWDNRWRILLVTGVAGALGCAYALMATPIYQATALVQVEKQLSGDSLLRETLDNSMGSAGQNSATQDEVSLAKSRYVIGKTVDDLGLTVHVSPDYFPLFGKGLARLSGEPPPVLRISGMRVPTAMQGQELTLTVQDKQGYNLSHEGKNLFSGTVGQPLQQGGWTMNVTALEALPGTVFTVVNVPRQKAVDDLRNQLDVAPGGKESGIMTFSLAGEDPQRAEAVLKSITDNYLQQNVDRKTEEAQRMLAFLNEQLPRTQTSLNNAENQLNQFRQQNDSVDLTLEAKSVLDTQVQLEAQLNELTFKEAEISKLYTRAHPAYRALLEKRATLETEKSRLGKQVQTLPKTQQEILRLTRDVQVDQQVYMQLMNKQQELSISKAGTVGNIRIIDEAESGLRPVKPQKAMIVFFALLMGGVLSASVVVLRAALHRGISDTEALEKRGINVYATVPLSPWQQKRNRVQQLQLVKSGGDMLPILAKEEPGDLSVEAIRSLRTSLHFAMMEAKNNVLMVSGASPASGKSFTSTNLAVVIAEAGQRVLLIDADMRKGFLHRWFNNSAKGGLSDMLSGLIAPDQSVKKTAIANLDFVPRGQVPPNPSELLMHQRFADFLQWAGQHYDLVLIDTPPVLAVTDAAIVGHHVGTALMVVRFEIDTVRQIETSIRRFEQNGVAIKGVILNGMVKKTATDAGYYAFAYPSHQEKV
ncbi:MULTISPECIES: polysaccharide biosynthesis tyrosine autokinase [unclassified Serratia (in: enterobacteria)]|uniref:polysaccharide biosynthesis tyrosine autokinase n=1 Tax=unclassified Serratia (in: enterobacteria) TaxID=2647522 RepID=UPI002ED2D156|nr:polysaccharide biosynthesis tyrosine autokinase [Serratia sp. C2(2)]MEE4446076.1 polysaccharide biosynthesis tyrosine autokinase [Serratia sp. C2(1)]